MTDTRIERDSMGELAVPATALYGAQTQRAVNNFPVSGQRMPQAFVRALLLAKAAAARANVSLQQLDAPMGEAIAETCLQLRIPRHSDTQPTLIRTPVPRSFG
ncbi:hypothetical protein ACSER5_10465, partial [Pseudomonas aeruginosa]